MVHRMVIVHQIAADDVKRVPNQEAILQVVGDYRMEGQLLLREMKGFDLILAGRLGIFCKIHHKE
jgi:hypothetical protein